MEANERDADRLVDVKACCDGERYPFIFRGFHVLTEYQGNTMLEHSTFTLSKIVTVASPHDPRLLAR